MGNYINTNLMVDHVVKEALSCQVARESQWTNKLSTKVECRDIFNKLEEVCFVPTPENTYVYRTACQKDMPKLKETRII